MHARRSRAAAESIATAILAPGGDATVILADVASGADRERLMAEAWQWRGRVDLWVNNAGADILTGPAAHGSFEEKLDRLWNVDVGGTIALSRAAGERMRAAGGGAIINIGWDQAATGMAGPSGEMFAAAKGAVMAFSKSLARSLAPRVRVNCIAPGWIRTAWGEAASDYWDRRARGEALLDRWGTPEDVAAAACYLASPGLFLTGCVLPVNGGFRGAFAEPPPQAPLKPDAGPTRDAL